MQTRTNKIPADALMCVDDFGYNQCTGGVVDKNGNEVGRGYMCNPADDGVLAFRKIPWYAVSCLSELVDVTSDFKLKEPQ